MNKVSRWLTGAGVVVLTLGLAVTGAQAHVTIDTLGAVEQGSFAKIGFSVPNERDDSGTVMIKVQMPQDHPLPFVSVQPKAGWDVVTETRTLETPIELFGSSYDEVVDTITWTAEEGTQIGPGQFDLFWVSAGVMPTDVTSLAFPTIQTYASGEEVAWIDPVIEGAAEPEHPAPTVALVPAGEGAGDEAVVGPDETETDDDGEDESNTLAIVALVVGALGLVVGGAALALARKRPAA